MANMQRSGAHELFRQQARMLYISNETIDMFLETAPLAQVRGVCDMIAFESSVRERRKRKRLFRKAKFPVIKSIDDYDFSQVVLPEDYFKDDLLTLDFAGRAQDFVFYGKTGRGKTHLAIAFGISAVNRGITVRFFSAAELVLALRRC
jgi:DNA replication protein DnaC